MQEFITKSTLTELDVFTVFADSFIFLATSTVEAVVAPVSMVGARILLLLLGIGASIFFSFVFFGNEALFL